MYSLSNAIEATFVPNTVTFFFLFQGGLKVKLMIKTLK